MSLLYSTNSQCYRPFPQNDMIASYNKISVQINFNHHSDKNTKQRLENIVLQYFKNNARKLHIAP